MRLLLATLLKKTMHLINASHWLEKTIRDKTLVQYINHPSCPTITHLSEALNPMTWAQQYQAFATVIVDQSSEEIVLVRDHWGCQPLYYFFDEQQLIFGEKLPDLLKYLKTGTNITQLQALLTGTQQYSDETFYTNIYRVEPGHILYFRKNKLVKKIPFWSLSAEADDITYTNPDDYLDHFSALLKEAVYFHTKNTPDLGAELSGGLDSSAILVTAHQQGLRYPLFMHIADPNSPLVDDQHLAQDLLTHLKRTDVQYINADQFDLLSVLAFCAEQFAGVAPYIFFMLANNIHQAAAQRGCKVLLSGAAGDECVSGHAPLSYFLMQLIQKKAYRDAWNTLNFFYQNTNKSFLFLRKIKALLQASPIFTQPYKSVRAFEWDLLQGPRSHETRMRVEYSAVIAKALGFEYRYPLLYPKLVDFCFRLPIHQKRQGRFGRYLIRRYLAQYAPTSIYTKQQKVGGIIPATLNKAQHYWAQGLLSTDLTTLPEVFLSANQTTNHRKLVTQIHAYMFKHYNTCASGLSPLP